MSDSDPILDRIDSVEEGSAHFDIIKEGDLAPIDPPIRFAQALGQIGPGLVLAGSIVGTGELIATTGLGAKEGYALLWLILFSCIIKVFVQVELGRHALTHGQSTLEAFNSLGKKRSNGNWICWCWFTMMLATQAQIGAMEGLIGQAATMAFPGLSKSMTAASGFSSDAIWATITTLVAIVLLLSGGYQRVEKITTFLVAAVTGFTVLAVLALPWTPPPVDFSLDAILSGLRFAMPSGGIAAAMATFGITGVGASELVAYPYWCLEKGYGRAAGTRNQSDAWARRARGWMRVMQIDAWFSMIVFTVGTLAFYILGASILHARGIVPAKSEMIRSLSQMYTSLGGWTVTAFLLGAWAVLFKTLYVATAGNARQTADFLNITHIWPNQSGLARTRRVNHLCIIYPLLALGLYLVFGDPSRLVTFGGFAQALMLPVIAGSALRLMIRDGDPRILGSKIWMILVVVAAILIGLVAGYGALDTLINQLKF
ncbi:MAG: Nramp family divalent metal transporter [Planctomycetota bacterium]|nr:Nramp family divalent metal transporter [Planctomycetota bacterium]